jgi:hypothetical protein
MKLYIVFSVLVGAWIGTFASVHAGILGFLLWFGIVNIAALILWFLGKAFIKFYKRLK